MALPGDGYIQGQYYSYDKIKLKIPSDFTKEIKNVNSTVFKRNQEKIIFLENISLAHLLNPLTFSFSEEPNQRKALIEFLGEKYSLLIHYLKFVTDIDVKLLSVGEKVGFIEIMENSYVISLYEEEDSTEPIIEIIYQCQEPHCNLNEILRIAGSVNYQLLPAKAGSLRERLQSRVSL